MSSNNFNTTEKLAWSKEWKDITEKLKKSGINLSKIRLTVTVEERENNDTK